MWFYLHRMIIAQLSPFVRITQENFASDSSLQRWIMIDFRSSYIVKTLVKYLKSVLVSRIHLQDDPFIIFYSSICHPIELNSWTELWSEEFNSDATQCRINKTRSPGIVLISDPIVCSAPSSTISIFRPAHQFRFRSRRRN